MSLFSSWSHDARAVLNASGARLSHSQTQEVLAAGLGHRTYASFKGADERQLDQAYLAVVCTDSMIRRGARFGCELSLETCERLVRELRLVHEWPRQHVEDLRSMGWVAKSALEEEGHPNRNVIAQAYGLSIFGWTVAKPLVALEPLADATEFQRWQGTGSLQLQSETADWAVPVVAEASFPKIGRHLLAKPHVTRFEQAGDPVETEFDYAVEGYLSESDL